MAEAELELYAWQREPQCPAVASLLLAASLARREQLENALYVLRRSMKQNGAEDQATAQLLVAILVKTDLLDATRRAATRLHDKYSSDASVTAWLHMMQAPGADELSAAPEAAVQTLASELAAAPQAILTLVTAAKLGWPANDVALLRGAVEQAGQQLTDSESQLTVCRALTQLALLANDQNEARRWAHQGLRIQPYCAALALALAKVEDDLTVGPPATVALTEAADHYPNYPDVQATLIRREIKDGRAAQARLRLSQWLAREPQQPMAQQLRLEMAA